MTHPQLAALILAAGKGTRMRSERAKVLHTVAGLPLVGYAVERALNLGAHPVVIVVGHQAELVQAEVDRRYPGKCAFEIQAQQNGTGHAVMQGMNALTSFEGRVLILSGDVPLLSQPTLERLLAETAPLAALSMRLANPTGYGRLIRDENGCVARVVEEKDATPVERLIKEVNAGVYAADASFLRTSLSKLKPNNAQREYYLTDLIEIAAGAAATVMVEDPNELLGANDRIQLAELDRIVQTRALNELMQSGVTVIDPNSTYIERNVVVGIDTTLYPNTHLRGRTVIGERCTIDTGSVLIDATIGSDVEIRPYSIIESAEVRSKAIIGPFARLRPGTLVEETAHVGNFVELKKTKLGRGAKANHLAYLGDAEIGAESNIGAGTITCNYDGFGKYTTNIGERVFVGSNATLVAPLKIDDDVYVAAGSTITEDVAAHGLVFGRAKQVEKKGRAKELRQEAKARAKKA